MSLVFEERDMHDEEFRRMNEGFEEHAAQHGQDGENHERYGLVAVDDGRFVGCSSGLAYRYGSILGSWFTLTDLWVEPDYRRKGIATELICRLEARLINLGLKNILLWTSGFEARLFYESRGYICFLDCRGWHPNGDSRLGYRKGLRV